VRAHNPLLLTQGPNHDVCGDPGGADAEQEHGG
jgi:hypothetical protein